MQPNWQRIVLLVSACMPRVLEAQRFPEPECLLVFRPQVPVPWAQLVQGQLVLVLLELRRVREKPRLLRVEVLLSRAESRWV